LNTVVMVAVALPGGVTEGGLIWHSGLTVLEVGDTATTLQLKLTGPGEVCPDGTDRLTDDAAVCEGATAKGLNLFISSVYVCADADGRNASANETQRTATAARTARNLRICGESDLNMSKFADSTSFDSRSGAKAAPAGLGVFRDYKY
jgi:hypothetical protein